MAAAHWNKEDFEAALSQGTPVLADFWAEWCGPCNMLAPVIEALSGKYAGTVTVGKVDVDAEPELAAQYRVFSIPTMILFKDGKEITRTVGVQPQADLEKLIDQNL